MPERIVAAQYANNELLSLNEEPLRAMPRRGAAENTAYAAENMAYAAENAAFAAENVAYAAENAAFAAENAAYAAENTVSAAENAAYTAENTAYAAGGGCIEPLYLDTPEGWRVAMRTLDYALCMAGRRALKNRCLVTGQPLDDCSYWTYADETPPAAGDLIALDEEMRKIIAANLPITVRHIPAQDAEVYFTASGQKALIEYVRNCGKSGIKVNVCAFLAAASPAADSGAASTTGGGRAASTTGGGRAASATGGGRAASPAAESGGGRAASPAASPAADSGGLFMDIYRAPLLPSTGLLPAFCLRKYHKGFVLIAEGSKGQKTDTFSRPAPPLLKLHDKYREWGRICGVDSVPALNAIAASGGRGVQEFIRLNEVYAEKNFSDVARDIANRRDNARIVMLAGPSSSGKTTSAKRLCLHLRVLGLLPIVISLDDYYLPPEEVPLDDEGKPDFECLEALDTPYLNTQLLALLNGEAVIIPKFDFKAGRRTGGRELRLSPRSTLIVEGIHALNDKLTPNVPQDSKYKLYVSALTQIKLDEHNRISASDNRLIRRIVRDNQFRGVSASRTLEMWPSVRRGELRHIFPFQNGADAIINSALEYELGVLRIYAEPLLRSVPAGEKVHAEAVRLLNILGNFAAIPPQYISGISILREFIGNSEFKY